MSENKKENIVPFCKDCNRDLELIQRLGDLESYISVIAIIGFIILSVQIFGSI